MSESVESCQMNSMRNNRKPLCDSGKRVNRRFALSKFANDFGKTGAT